MKTTYRFIIFVIFILAIGACKKEAIEQEYASINIINASVGAGTIKVNYFGKPISWAANTGTVGSIPYGANESFTIFNFNNDYLIKVVLALDTLKSIMNDKLSIQGGGIYSLYTTGQAEKYDYVFTKETSIPYNLNDSVVSVRFINLSLNSPAVNVTLASTPSVNEAAGLVYKQQTEFKNYSLKKNIAIGSVTFQVRDATTNTILTSYTLPNNAVSPYTKVSTSLSRFKSITIAIKGISGIGTGTNAYSAFPISHY